MAHGDDASILRPGGDLPVERPRVAVVASLTSSLVGFRYDLLKELAGRADVLTLAPDEDSDTVRRLERIGVRFERIPMARTGVNPFQDLLTLIALVRAFRAFRPDIVLPYTMKPIIYAGLAARITGVRKRIAMCTGLGYLFVEGGRSSLSRRALRLLSMRLYRAALRDTDEVIVYNAADAEAFRRFHLVDGRTRISVVPGSGINLQRHVYSAPPPGPPVYLMVARLLRDKGVREYVAAARLLRQTHPHVRCQLLGPHDPNPASITSAELQDWIDEGAIEYLGSTSDVRPYLERSTVFVLPSYREGLSRSVLEAMATGRAVVTSDAPGCAEPVVNGVSGFVVPVRDAPALAAAMARFLHDPDLAERMGRAARNEAERRFDVTAINEILLARLGLSDGPQAVKA